LIFKLILTGKSKIAYLLMVTILCMGAYTVFKIFGNSSGKFNSILFSEQASNKSSRDPRFLIWKSAIKIAGDKPLIGVGIGDARNELTKEYISLGKEEMIKERLNAHNQFLEVLLESGITGLIFFLTIFVLMFYIAVKDRNLVYGTFTILVFMFFIIESILYRFAGVSFFSLFSFLLIHFKSGK